MIEIKICGITNLEDALAACEAGADAIGFIFYPQSQRYVFPEQAIKIIGKLPPEICRVGVFVNTDLLNLKDIASFCKLDLLQLHGDETPEFCRQFPASRLIKSLAPKDMEEVKKAEAYQTRAILIDAPRQAQDGSQNVEYGGTGKMANWDMAIALKAAHRLILAGGLKPENTAEAIAAVSPDALDFNSGVEITPRHKDAEKIRQVIAIARKVETRGEVKKDKIFSRLEP